MSYLRPYCNAQGRKVCCVCGVRYCQALWKGISLNVSFVNSAQMPVRAQEQLQILNLASAVAKFQVLQSGALTKACCLTPEAFRLVPDLSRRASSKKHRYSFQHQYRAHAACLRTFMLLTDMQSALESSRRVDMSAPEPVMSKPVSCLQRCLQHTTEGSVIGLISVPLTDAIHVFLPDKLGHSSQTAEEALQNDTCWC